MENRAMFVFTSSTASWMLASTFTQTFFIIKCHTLVAGDFKFDSDGGFFFIFDKKLGSDLALESFFWPLPAFGCIFYFIRCARVDSIGYSHRNLWWVIFQEKLPFFGAFYANRSKGRQKRQGLPTRINKGFPWEAFVYRWLFRQGSNLRPSD